MATDETKVTLEDGNTYDRSYYTAYELDFNNIKSGLRKDPQRSCQYFFKGLPGVCKWWQPTTSSGSEGYPFSCSYVPEDPEDPESKKYPSSYPNCDRLGRSTMCTRYETEKDEDGNVVEDLDAFRCVVPDVFRSGVGLKIINDGFYLLTSLPLTSISGYNMDESDGSGLCDGMGMGKGKVGFEKSIEQLNKLPTVCKYYRPWSMGFGAVEPNKRLDKITPYSEADIELITQPLGRRIPLNLKVYNLRAKLQKCSFWDDVEGYEFFFDTEVTGGTVMLRDSLGELKFLDVDKKCTCTDVRSNDYSELSDQYNGEEVFILANVLAKNNTIVCNGAKPECPFYTGKWIYCVDSKMRTGMRISAKQILELRFWLRDWSSQKEYDDFFTLKPGTNPDDPSTPDIYTFTKWERVDIGNPWNSIMLGKKFDMCQPAPLIGKSFDFDTYVTVTDIRYPKALEDLGTEGLSNPIFPTLIRDLDEFLTTNPFSVIFPFPNKDPFGNTSKCKSVDKVPYVKRSNSIEQDMITVIGHTLRDKKIFVINDSEYKIDSTILKYDAGFYIPDSERTNFFKSLNSFIYETMKGTSPEYLYETSSDTHGVFTVDNIRLLYSKLNKLFICVDYGDGTWDFCIREVWSQFYGGIVVQNKFEYRPSGIIPPLPITYAMMPAATVEGKVYTFCQQNTYGCTISLDASSVKSVFQDPIPNQEGSTAGTRVSYCIKKNLIKNKIVLTYGKIGNSNLYLVGLYSDKINYVYNWGIDKAMMHFIVDDESVQSNIPDIEMEVVDSFSKDQLHPDIFIIKVKNDNEDKSFNRDTWELVIDFYYETLENNTTLETNKELSEADGGNDADARLTATLTQEILYPDLSDDPQVNNAVVSGPTFIYQNDTIRSYMGDKTLAFLCEFKDEEGRIICAHASKFLGVVPKYECRSVEIRYAYNREGARWVINPTSGPAYLEPMVVSYDVAGGMGSWGYAPPCGDHKVGKFVKRNGFVWYPFDSCGTQDYYNVETNTGNNCHAFLGVKDINPEGYVTTAGALGTHRLNYRMCGPPKCKVEAQAPWASYRACYFPWDAYYYESSGDGSFTGQCNYSKRLDDEDIQTYKFNDWVFPPFGNSGREFVEYFFTCDNNHYLSMEDIPGTVKQRWMPIVPDKPMFNFNFNSFNKSTWDIEFVSQINYMTNSKISEQIDSETGYRFDDVIVGEGEGWCSYPPPLIEGAGGSVGVRFYLFKKPDTAWAWRSKWLDIERNIGDDDGRSKRLAFVNLDYIDYKYDLSKLEHRLTCDNGTHLINFSKPTIEGVSLSKYPSISLDDGPERYFEIIYDSYTHYNVFWCDEGSGEVGGSSGGENNIYEKTTGGGDWVMPFHVIYQAGAVAEVQEAKDLDRYYVESYDSYDVPPETIRVYNQGLETHIYRDYLKYLPYEIKDVDGINKEKVTLSYDPNVDTEAAEDYVFNVIHKDYVYDLYNEYKEGEGVITHSIDSDYITVSIDFSEVEGREPALGVCLRSFSIKGEMGPVCKRKIKEVNKDGNEVTREEILYACKPSISIISSGFEDEGGVGYTIEDGTSSQMGEGLPDKELYSIDFILEIDPLRMTSKRTKSITITLTPTNDEYMVLALEPIDFLFKDATYCDAQEKITTYERLYTVSSMNITNPFKPLNNDGSILRRDFNEDNSGLFFPQTLPAHESPFTSYDKIREVYAGDLYYDEVPTENPKDPIASETGAQSKMFNIMTSLGKGGYSNTFGLSLPKAYTDFFKENNITYKDVAGNAVFSALLPSFGDLDIAKRYKSYSRWSTSGHVYMFNKDIFTMEQCFFIDGLHKIATIIFVHLDTYTGAVGEGDSLADPLDAATGWVREQFYKRRLYLTGEGRSGW